MTQAIAAPQGPGHLPYYVKALAMAIPALMLGFQISGWIFFLPGAMQGHADFRQLYSAAAMVRTGRGPELYDYVAQKRSQDTLVSPEAVLLPFIRPAYSAFLFVPFSFFSYRTAYFLFLAVNVTLLVACYLLLRPQLSSLVPVWDQLPIALLVSFLPIGAALMQGQDSVLLLFLLLLAMVPLRRGSDLLAGALVGAGIFKLQLTIPIALFFLGWRRWRFVGGFAFAASTAGLLSIWITGLRPLTLYLRSLFSIGTTFGRETSPLYHSVPLELMTNIHALVYGTLKGYASSLTISVASVCLSIVFAVWVAVYAAGLSRSRQFVVSVAGATLVSFYGYVHDMSIVVLPLALGLSGALGTWAHGKLAKILALGSAVVFTAPVFLVFAPLHCYLICLAEAGFLSVLMLFFREHSTEATELETPMSLPTSISNSKEIR